MQYQQVQASPVTLIHESGRANYAPLQAYLAFLQDQFKRNPAELDLSAIDGLEIVDGKLKINAINKTAINQAFMQMPERPAYVLPEGLARDISDNQTRIVQAKKDRLEGEVRNYRRECESLTAQHAQYMVRIVKNVSEIKEMGGESLGLAQKVQAIGEAGFWRPVGYNTPDAAILFESSDDIWVKFNDLEAGVNKAFNAGKFKIKLYLNEGLRMKINGYGAGNIIVRDHIHPHVARGGDLCLGNASASYHDAITSLDLEKMFDITRIILTTYAPDNPYVSFEDFFVAFQRQQTLTLRTPNVAAINAAYAATIANASDDLDWYDATIANF